MTNAAVDYLTTESAPQKLWKEWLTGFFDGGSHEIGPSGTGAVTFPVASISFDQAEMPQPLSGVAIAVISQTISEHDMLTATGKWVRQEMRWNFMVRAATVAQGQGNPEYQCRLATEKLKACLMNDFTIKPLQQKGIYDLIVSEAEPIQSTAFIMRRLKVKGRYEFEIQTSL